MDKFKLALVGPTNPDKLKIIERLSDLDISEAIGVFEDNSIYTTEFSLSFIFSPNFRKIRVRDYQSKKNHQEKTLVYLQKVLEDKGLKSFFKLINSMDFINTSTRVTVELPLVEGILPHNNVFNELEIIENRGFLDGELNRSQKLRREEVHAILFYVLDYIKSPRSFTLPSANYGVIMRDTGFVTKNYLAHSKSQQLEKNSEKYMAKIILRNILTKSKGYMQVY